MVRLRESCLLVQFWIPPAAGGGASSRNQAFTIYLVSVREQIATLKPRESHSQLNVVVKRNIETEIRQKQSILAKRGCFGQKKCFGRNSEKGESFLIKTPKPKIISVKTEPKLFRFDH